MNAARLVLVVGALAGLGACARSRELFPESDMINVDPTTMDWGTYAAGLDVPACPASPVLVVNTTADADADINATVAGPELSLRQALWLVWHQTGPYTIQFDPQVFPVDRPATINVGRLVSGFPFLATPLCIDGRGRGVVIDFSADSAGFFNSIWGLPRGSLQVGLTLLHVPYEQTVLSSQVAGCRIGTDGIGAFASAAARPWSVELMENSTFGPGNAVAGTTLGVRLLAGSNSRVFSNTFGYDPLTQRCLSSTTALDLLAPSMGTINDNVFMTAGDAIRTDTTGGTTFTVRDNRFGVDRKGTIPCSSPIQSAARITFGDWTFGPGNIVRGGAPALLIGGANVHITQNSISAGQQGIVFTAAAPVAAPTLTTVSANGVTGQCPIAGTVEVFADPGDEGAQYLGTTSCDGTNPWSLAVAAPSGQNVTATLTDAQNRTSAFSAPLPVP